MFKALWTKGILLCFVISLFLSPSVQGQQQQQPSQISFEVDLREMQTQIADGTAPLRFDFLANQQRHRVIFPQYLRCLPDVWVWAVQRRAGRVYADTLVRQQFSTCSGLDQSYGANVVTLSSLQDGQIIATPKRVRLELAVQATSNAMGFNLLNIFTIPTEAKTDCRVTYNGEPLAEELSTISDRTYYLLPKYVLYPTIDVECASPIEAIQVFDVDTYAEQMARYSKKLDAQYSGIHRSKENPQGDGIFIAMEAPKNYAPVLIQSVEFFINATARPKPPVTIEKILASGRTHTPNAPVCPGSIIRTDTMAVGEKIPLTGTGFDLVYFSDRVFGRSDDRTVRIPLTGANVSGIDKVKLVIKIAGREFIEFFPPTPNQFYDFTWDGLDQDGVRFGTALPLITVAYINLDGTIEKTTSRPAMGHWISEFHGLGGWMLSPIHKYDVRNQRLNQGDGESRVVDPLPYGEELLIASTDASEAYIFDKNGTHLRTLNTLTGDVIYTIAYNERRRPLSITDQFGNVTTIDRSPDGTPVSITGPFGQKTLLTISNNYLSQVTNPKGDSHSMTYTQGGLMLSFQKPNGLATTFNYGPRGALRRDTGSGGNFTALTDLINGDMRTVTTSSALNRSLHIDMTVTPDSSKQVITDSRGLITQLEHKPEGELNRSPEGLSYSSVSAHDPRFGDAAVYQQLEESKVAGTHLHSKSVTARLAELSNPQDPLSMTRMTVTTTLQDDLDRVAQSDYVSASREMVSVSPMGRTSKQVLNDKSLIALSQIGNLEPVQYSYTARGQLASIAQGSRTSSMSYDSLGQLAAMTDSLGRRTVFEYDLAGRVISQTRPDGKKIMFQYDSAGNLVAVTPPEKMLHRFSLNAFELVGSYLPPALPNALTPTSYNYNLDKQLVSINRPDGKVVSFDYHPSSGILQSIQAPDASVNFSYSATSGQLTSLSSSDGVTTNIQYLGPLPSSIANTGTGSGSLNLSYDPEFRLSQLAVTGGQSLAMSYDKDSLLIQSGAKSYTRRLNDGLVTASEIGKIKESLVYNGFGEVMSNAHVFIEPRGHGHHKHKNKTKTKELFKLEVERDALGRIVEKTEVVKGERHKMKYQFDQAGRLVLAQGRRGFRSYSYDANGNRTFMSEGGFKHGKRYEYDSQDRLIKAGDVVYRYNLNGDLAEKIGDDFEVEYFYDSLGNLKTVNFPKDIHHDKDCNKDFWRKHRKQRKDYRIDYIVDGMGRRVGKKVNGRLVQQFVWQSQLQIAAELDGQGRLVKQFVYGSKVNVPDYMLMNGRTYSIITDQLGSPRLVVDASSGTIAQEMEYDELGNVLKDSALGFTPFGFAGGLYDRDTKLVRFGARDYDPEVGRFTSKDPSHFKGNNANLYGYGPPDPVNGKDFDGRDYQIFYDQGGGIIPHYYARIWDPKMPGNSVYVDLYPAVDIGFTNLNATVAAVVDIQDSIPISAKALPGSRVSTSSAVTSRLLEAALRADKAADDGTLRYNFLAFTWDKKNGVTNCKGFVEGIAH